MLRIWARKVAFLVGAAMLAWCWGPTLVRRPQLFPRPAHPAQIKVLPTVMVSRDDTSTTRARTIALAKPGESRQLEGHSQTNGLLRRVPSPPPTFKPFVPSYEWQEVQEGQAIPAGLYVKIDLQTGHKVARLLRDRPGVTLESERNSDASHTSLSGAKRRRARIARERQNRHL